MGQTLPPSQQCQSSEGVAKETGAGGRSKWKWWQLPDKLVWQHVQCVMGSLLMNSLGTYF